MSWKDKIIIRILLLVAKMLSSDAKLSEDLQGLANHISAQPNASTI